MSNLILQTKTMTSVEIAALVERRHDNVKRTIETLVNQGVICQPQFEDGIKSANGVVQKHYVFSGEQGKLDSITVVAQLCPQFTARLVKRWYELEQQLAKPADPIDMLSNPVAMRNLLLGYTEKVIELESKLEETKPKVQALDRLATADGSLCITDAAKQLQMRPKDLFAYLSINQWIYRRTGCANWIAYQDKIQQGLLEHKTTEVTRSDGSTKISDQVRILPKGLTKLAERMEAA